MDNPNSLLAFRVCLEFYILTNFESELSYTCRCESLPLHLLSQIPNLSRPFCHLQLTKPHKPLSETIYPITQTPLCHLTLAALIKLKKVLREERLKREMLSSRGRLAKNKIDIFKQWKILHSIVKLVERPQVSEIKKIESTSSGSNKWKWKSNNVLELQKV
ncbi:hypothetical protein RchiOBHm_Chr7g0226641 [Rosa chinensis]|uniref:Uncharacterized protein n=1 Tax=Rosa chinensis TaxID=74649 RepID=A0A2P6PEE9_ROSCH|nr:hypothetical protein RchiOBHm_Chr7g0226641 [Rosa chinensis]